MKMPKWSIPNLFNLGVKDLTELPDGPAPDGELLAAMSPVHVHAWELETKTFARPRKDVDISKLSEELAQKAMFGATTLVWLCQSCGEMRAEEVLGAEEGELDDVIEKVRLMGPQLLERDGERFVVARAMTQAPGTLPIR